ncbi:hypothetical protein [Nonomuraea sp. NPDC049607]|uniref:hypothetical protein n=1 Tax=unclassified Nonomuraea TaxID=2593643 RepID=UPI0034197E2F
MNLRKLSLTLAGAAMLSLPALIPSAAWADPLPSGCTSYVYSPTAAGARCSRGVGYVAAGVLCQSRDGYLKWFWGDWAPVPSGTASAFCKAPYDDYAISSSYSVKQ